MMAKEYKAKGGGYKDWMRMAGQVWFPPANQMGRLCHKPEPIQLLSNRR